MKEGPPRDPQSAVRLRLPPVLAFVLLAACGGGGSTDALPTEPPPPGVAGRVLGRGLDLGCVAEQEPNDSLAQPFRLPPLPPAASLAVVGVAAAEAGASGPADGTDVFSLEVLEDQDVVVDLAWGDAPPGTALALAAHAPEGGPPLDDAPAGASPRQVAFRAEAGVLYRLVLTAPVGAAAWTLTTVASDPSVPATALTPEPRPTLSARPSAPDGSDFATTHVLVGLREGASETSLAARFGLAVGRRLGGGARTLRLPEGGSGRIAERIRSWCARLAADPDVLWAEPDWVVKPLGRADDPDLARQWNLRAIQAEAAWEVTRGDPAVAVGIVDSGIVYHPDLAGQVLPGYDFISSTSYSGDGDERDADPTDPGAADHSSGRSAWHGTHVAAIVAARADDGVGIAGVAPGCRVMPLRAVGIGGGLASDVADAILFGAGLLATEEGYRLSAPLPILNLSFGVDVDSTAIRLACERAANVGVLLVGATGNDGQRVLYPAAYPSVLAVGAVDALLLRPGYSNFGPEVELSAPGGDRDHDLLLDGWPDGILSCVRDDTVHPARASHAYLEGTSQAAPHVAGVGALLLSVKRDLTRADLVRILTGSALDRGEPGPDIAYGWGVVQAHAALRLLFAELGTPLEVPPAPWLATTSIGFVGFEDRATIPVGNVGGGRIAYGDPLAVTDDGQGWLLAERVPEPTGAGPSDTKAVVVRVDRTLLGNPGPHPGTVFLRDPSGTVLGLIRVVAYVQQRPFAGQDLKVLALDASTGIPHVTDIATAVCGYRYWMTAIGAGGWKIRAGQDLDGDGFSCENGDACGWHGGTTQDDAAVIDLGSRTTRLDVDVVIQRSGPLPVDPP